MGSSDEVERRTAVVVPPGVDPVAIAVHHVCGHCDGGPARVTGRIADVWQVFVPHSAGCPVLGGTVSDVPDILRAALASAAPPRMKPTPRRRPRRARRRRQR